MGAYDDALLKWAFTYNGYERLAREPESFAAMLEPLRRAFNTNGHVPEWAGVDLLRGWAFHIARTRYWSDCSPAHDYPEIRAIAEAIRKHPDAKVRDRPPDRH